MESILKRWTSHLILSMTGVTWQRADHSLFARDPLELLEKIEKIRL
jgi:hypothetical protein